jgi:hypothetical protein
MRNNSSTAHAFDSLEGERRPLRCGRANIAGNFTGNPAEIEAAPAARGRPIIDRV